MASTVNHRYLANITIMKILVQQPILSIKPKKGRVNTIGYKNYQREYTRQLHHQDKKNLHSLIFAHSFRDDEIREVVHTQEFSKIIITEAEKAQVNVTNLKMLDFGDVLIDPRGNEHPDLTKLN